MAERGKRDSRPSPTGGRIDIARLKALVPINDLIQQKCDPDPRKSDFRNGDLWYCCPFHEERTPSFHADNRRGFYKCFGCGDSGDHITWLTATGRAATVSDAIAILAEMAGLSHDLPPKRQARAAPTPPPRERDHAGHARAKALWDETVPADPVLAAYLQIRGVLLEPCDEILGGMPAALRYHPALPYFERDRSGRWRQVHRGSAMIGQIGRKGLFGVHRTWISANGRQRCRGVKLDKKWLGMRHAMFGQPVVIADAGELGVRRMIVGEGIETTMALWSHLAAQGEIWGAEAALARDAIAGPAHPLLQQNSPRPVVAPDWDRYAWRAPDEIDELVILAEGSSKDPQTAQTLTMRAVHRHGRRSDGRARDCSYRLPGGDWARDVDYADLCAGARE